MIIRFLFHETLVVENLVILHLQQLLPLRKTYVQKHSFKLAHSIL